MKKRNVAAVVILTIITFGIYGIYWGYVTARDLQKESGEEKIPLTALLALLILSSNAGGALLGYDCHHTLNVLQARNGKPQSYDLTLWLILGGIIPVVTMAFIQNEVNKL